MISLRADFILLLKDSYNGSVITGPEHTFLVNGIRITPIRKPEGYYVFSGLGDGVDSFSVIVMAEKYLPYLVSIDKVDQNPEPVALRLYRKPNVYYGDCEMIVGKCEPHTEVMTLSTGEPVLKLQAYGETGGKHWIALQGYTTQRLVGLEYTVGEGEERELFSILSKNLDGSYQIDQPFKFKHAQREQVRRSYRGISDETGQFCIPVESGQRGRACELEYFNKEVNEWGFLCMTEPD